MINCNGWAVLPIPARRGAEVPETPLSSSSSIDCSLTFENKDDDKDDLFNPERIQPGMFQVKCQAEITALQGGQCLIRTPGDAAARRGSADGPAIVLTEAVDRTAVFRHDRGAAVSVSTGLGIDEQLAFAFKDHRAGDHEPRFVCRIQRGKPVAAKDRQTG